MFCLHALVAVGACTIPGNEPAPANLAGVAEWQLSAAPVFSIGGDDQRPGYSLTSVDGALFLDDGGVVLLDRSDGRVGFYSPGGSLRMISKKGGGPGEMRGSYSLSLDARGDVHVWDMSQRRITTFAPDGRFTGSHTVGRGSMLGLGWPIRTLHDGSVWTAEVDQTPAATVGTSFLSMSIVRFDPITWSRLGVLAVMPGQENFTKIERGTRGGAPVIFGRKSMFSGGLDLIAADTESPVFFVLDSLGDTTRTIEVPWTPIDVPKGAVEAARAAAITKAEAMHGGPNVPPSVVADFRRRALLALSEVPGRETFPAWQDFFQSRDGSIWIEIFALPDSPFTQTLVLSRNGDMLGTLRLSVGMKILDALNGQVLVRSYDEWDVPTVSVLEIETTQ